MPLSKGCTKKTLHKNVTRLRREGYPASRAFAAAARTQREHCACRNRRGPRGGRQLVCKPKRRS